MDVTGFTLSVLFLYFALVIGVSWIYRSGSDDASFAIANRQVGFWPTTSSIIGGVRDGAGIVLWVTAGATGNYQFVWALLGVSVGFITLGCLGRHLRKRAIKNNLINISDYLKTFVGTKTSHASVGLLLIYATIYSSVQLYVSGNVISQLLGYNPAFGIILSAGVVGFYLVLGGYKSIVMTDLVQLVLMFLILMIPLIFLEYPPLSAIEGSLAQTPSDLAWAYALFGFCFSFGAPDFWQRIFSSRSGAVASHSFFTALIVLGIVTYSLMVFGFYMGSVFPDINYNNLYQIFNPENSSSPWITAAIAVLVYTVLMSTLDTYTYVFTSNFTKNYLGIDNVRHHKKYVSTNRMMIMAFLVVLVILALSIQDMVAYFFDLTMIISVLIPLLVYVIYASKFLKRLNDEALSLTLVVGMILYFSMYFTGMFKDFTYNMIPMGVVCGMILIFHLGFKERVKSVR